MYILVQIPRQGWKGLKGEGIQRGSETEIWKKKTRKSLDGEGQGINSGGESGEGDKRRGQSRLEA